MTSNATVTEDKEYMPGESCDGPSTRRCIVRVAPRRCYLLACLWCLPFWGSIKLAELCGCFMDATCISLCFMFRLTGVAINSLKPLVHLTPPKSSLGRLGMSKHHCVKHLSLFRQLYMKNIESNNKSNAANQLFWRETSGASLELL